MFVIKENEMTTLISTVVINKEQYGHLLVEDVTETLGLLPVWVQAFNILGGDDIVNFMRDKYQWGLYKFNGAVTESGAYKSEYDEDEDLDYIAKMKTKEGTVYFYPYAITALPTPDGYYITRMD